MKKILDCENKDGVVWIWKEKEQGDKFPGLRLSISVMTGNPAETMKLVRIINALLVTARE